MNSHPLKIAIIGAGRVGSALAAGWHRAGHKVLLGLRDPAKGAPAELNELDAGTAAEAAARADIVLVATPPAAAVELARAGIFKDKIVIDATNSVRQKPQPYRTAAEGIKDLGGTDDVVKCFNTTGFENMADPRYGDQAIDMFMAGDSARGKETARRLALDQGFAECLDFGGDESFEALENFAFAWINLAIMQGQGRDIAFKVLRR